MTRIQYCSNLSFWGFEHVSRIRTHSSAHSDVSLEAVYYTLCWLENEISKSISNHVSIRYENKLAHTHVRKVHERTCKCLRSMIRRTITLKSLTTTKIDIPESYKDSGVCVHCALWYTLGIRDPSLENIFSRRGWVTKRKRATMRHWCDVFWFDRCFQLWSCDRAPYLLPRESLGAWTWDSDVLYDLLPPRLRTSSNAPSSRRL